MMRARLTDAMKDAMRAKDQQRLTTVRLILAAIKDHDLGIKPVGGKAGEPAGDAEITQILSRMIKQRRDSIEAYEKAGRTELAQKEKDEIAIVEEFLPKQMDEAEARAAVAAAIKESGAQGPKDMGKVMGVLKQRHAGQMDFGRASGLVKELLR
jgi:uncharacterized protein YqeY